MNTVSHRVLLKEQTFHPAAYLFFPCCKGSLHHLRASAAPAVQGFIQNFNTSLQIFYRTSDAVAVDSLLITSGKDPADLSFSFFHQKVTVFADFHRFHPGLKGQQQLLPAGLCFRPEFQKLPQQGGYPQILLC